MLVFVENIPMNLNFDDVAYRCPASDSSTGSYSEQFQQSCSSSLDATTSTVSISTEPSEMDVVCGRGKGSYQRAGNIRFREIAAKYVQSYQNTRTRVDKSIILNQIINEVTGNGARFIKFSKKERRWTTITEEMAREKVGHAIREAISSDGKNDNKEERQAAFEEKHARLLSTQRKIFARMVKQAYLSIDSN